MLAVLVVTAALQAQSRPATLSDAIQRRVQRLGEAQNDDFADAQELAKTPVESAGALVAELHAIAHPERAKEIENIPATVHVISCIQVLRFITGAKDFCATTQWKFGRSREEDNRRYWLYFKSPKCVTFFAIWPSRGRTYFAPLDAQQEIILQWRRWYTQEGTSYRYQPLPSAPDKILLLWQEAAGVYSPPGAR
ncbi:MAG: hypothetical protein LAN36_12995 [Acidobacteriia bacterium]|nr:hypothetical protein [Terriglobia bacterium]